MIRVLFVDDEPEVLAGIQRMLRTLRHEWEVKVAVGSAEAMSELEVDSFDVVVSDMRMPEMDGAELLEWVRRHHPATLRILLSGHTEVEATQRSLPVAHQFLAKPCSKEELVDAVTRASTVLDIMADDRVREALGGVGRLVSPTPAVIELGDLLAEDPVDFDRVREVIGSDVAMSTKVLQLVNSAFFGLPRAITDPQEAVIYLGLDCLRYVFIASEMLQALRLDPTTSRVADRLQAHASRRADLAFELAGMAGHRTRSAREIWVGAFLADVGAIAIAMSNAEFAAWLLDGTTDDVGGRMQELDLLVPAAGGYLLSIWGLPHQIVESVVLSRSQPSGDSAQGAGFIWLADVLAGADQPGLDELDDGVLEAMGIPRESFSARAGSGKEGSNP